MGIESAFDRQARDFYPTPPEAVAPLLRYLPPACRFVEPCAGDGALVRALESAGHRCVAAMDIEPQRRGIARGCALQWQPDLDLAVITNPPYDRAILEPLMRHWLAERRLIWLLLDARRMHVGWFAPFLAYAHSIVSVGRVQWFPGTAGKGTKDYCWFGFSGGFARSGGGPVFYARLKQIETRGGAAAGFEESEESQAPDQVRGDGRVESKMQ